VRGGSARARVCAWGSESWRGALLQGFVRAGEMA